MVHYHKAVHSAMILIAIPKEHKYPLLALVRILTTNPGPSMLTFIQKAPTKFQKSI